ncbi:unnamed protein product, partial [Vitis vinifera]|uniref:Uncharacterized protein n=1 Tax=Vitis vinifera TaxID=29760 RepID=D7SPU9_VITVI
MVSGFIIDLYCRSILSWACFYLPMHEFFSQM